MNLKLIAMTTVLSAAASVAGAKGHNQSNTDVPGQNVGMETVTTAQQLGTLKGNATTAPVTDARIKAGR